MIIIEKKTIENYENSYSYQMVVNYDYAFERDILEKYLSQATEESKLFLKRQTKGENKNGK